MDESARVKDLTAEEIGRIRQVIENSYRVEGSLRTEIALSIKRLKDIGCYRGWRHRRGSAVPRPEDENERAHAQGTEEDSRRQEEEGRQEGLAGDGR